MSRHESRRATTEARDSVGRSTAPISRHDVALQRYLGAMKHATEIRRDGADEEWHRVGAADGAHQLLSEISTGPPTVTLPADAAEHDPAATARTDLVVVGVDGSPHARKAADWAAAQAARRHWSLRLVHAYSLPIAGYAGYSMAPANLGRLLRVQGGTLLRKIAVELEARHPGLDVSTRLIQGDAVVALRRESERARLTVVGSRGQGRVSGVLLGSVALAITAHGTAPVAVVPAEGQGGDADGPVVVGVDGSATGDAAIGYAFADAAARGASLVAVRAWNDSRPRLPNPSAVGNATLEEGERAWLDERLTSWRAGYPKVEVEAAVIRARPPQALLTYARNAQLLVVGSRGRGGLAGMLLGSTSHALITHSLCPVVVVRPDSMT